MTYMGGMGVGWEEGSGWRGDIYIADSLHSTAETRHCKATILQYKIKITCFLTSLKMILKMVLDAVKLCYLDYKLILT